MNKEKTVIPGTNGITEQQMELFNQQIREGKIDGRVIKSITEHRNPWPHWNDDGGIIVFFDLVSNGMTGKEWITHFERKGFPLDEYTQSILLSKDFKPTEVGKIHHVRVIKGSFFTDKDRITETIILNAKSRMRVRTASPEVACLICDNFIDKDLEKMRFKSIITMHGPVSDCDCELRVLGTKGISSGLGIGAYRILPDDGWSNDYGFAFEG
jgi:hypothetical protein